MSEPKEIDLNKMLHDAEEGEGKWKATTIIQAHREHRWHMGHRVVNHESKCKYLHGHEYVVTFYCEAPQLDKLGRVIDFGVIKQRLCNWIDVYWDHRFMMWENDPTLPLLRQADDQLVVVPFNPTAENMALHLLEVVCPQLLSDTDIRVTKIVLMETSKCGVTCEL